jgi:hypothetical protein
MRQINNLLYFYIFILIKTQYLGMKILFLNILLVIVLKFNYSILLPPIVNLLIYYVLYLSFKVDRKKEFDFFYKINNIPAFLVFLIKLVVISIFYIINFFILLKFGFFEVLSINVAVYLLSTLAFFSSALYTYNKSFLSTALIFIFISLVNIIGYYFYPDIILFLLCLQAITIISYLIFNIKKVYDQI